MAATPHDKPAPDEAEHTPIAPAKSVTLPLTFANSFWSPDYRAGFERLYNQLEAAIVQSDEVIHHIQRRADAERSMAAAVHPHALRLDGFGIDEGASAKMGLEALLSSFVQEARGRAAMADELSRAILIPFENWSEGHKGRVRSSRALLEGHLGAYEKRLGDMNKLKSLYDEACRIADAAEDELAFLQGGATKSPPPVNGSPSLAATSSASPVAITPTTATTPSPAPAPASAPAPILPRTESTVSAAGEEDDGGIDDDDSNLFSRSGSTGGSITAALGRAFTTRRKAGSGRGPSSSSTTTTTAGTIAEDSAEAVKDLAAPILADPNVVAALDWSKSTFAALRDRVSGIPSTGQGRNEKARKEAEAAEDKYKAAVEALDSARLVLEEALSEHFTYVHRCEMDRVRAEASALRAFHALVTGLSAKLEGVAPAPTTTTAAAGDASAPAPAVAPAPAPGSTSSKVASALQLIRPERDVYAIIERLRTGPFQPRPTSYHSHYSEPAIHSFGIDLRKFEETNPNAATDKVPPVLRFLLDTIKERYPKVAEAERRKAWLYETPLASQHHLRSALNNPNSLDRAAVEKYDLPVLASTVKLWLLELDVPVVIFSHYDEYRALYPKRVGAEVVETPSKLIASHLARLPAVHLELLRALIEHFHTLVSSTKTDESDEVYLQKLSLSIARCLVRPKVETALTLDDRFPALLFVDLVKSYEDIFKASDELKEKQREDRYKPRRQRTKPIDVRVSRSRIGVEGSASLTPDQAGEILKSGGTAGGPPPVPPLPPSVVIPAASSSGQPPHTSAPLAASPLEQSPEAPLPPVAPDAPGAAALSPDLGKSGMRRSARGPRPLPGSAATPTSPPPPAAGAPALAPPATLEASAPPADDDTE